MNHPEENESPCPGVDPDTFMCPDARFNQLVKDVAEIKMAVRGDEEIGQAGLGKRVERLEAWKSVLDLRIAGISGIIIGAVAIIKYLIAYKPPTP